MGVDDVGPQIGGVDPLEGAFRELSDVLRHRSDRDVGVGAGGDVDHAIARTHLGQLGRAAVRPPGEHGDVDAALGHRQAQLVDVHVHPPGVACPRRAQRARVHRDVDDLADHAKQPVTSYKGRGAAPSRNL